MKQPEYTEGPEALANFERMATEVFKAPKAEVVKAEKKMKKGKSGTSSRGKSIRKSGQSGQAPVTSMQPLHATSLNSCNRNHVPVQPDICTHT